MRFFGGLVQVDVLVHARYPSERNEVVLAPSRRVVLGELDAVSAVHVINGANVAAVGAEDREMFFDVGWIHRDLMSTG